MAYLGLFRVVMIIYFRAQLDAATGLSDVLLAMAHGFRFDSGIGAILMLAPFLSSLALSPLGLTQVSAALRRGLSLFMHFVLTLACVATLPYFAEYDSQFDHFLFELLYDDQRAVIYTILRAYHGIGTVLLVGGLTLGSHFLLQLWLRRPIRPLRRLLAKPQGWPQRLVMVIVLFLLTFAAARGSFRSRPAMRKWADITPDVFLNKTVMNPLRHLNYAFKDFRRINSRTAGIQELLGRMPVQQAAADYFGRDLPADEVTNLTTYLERIAPGSAAPLPRHIFLIILESFDSWPLLPEYRSLGIAEKLHDLAARGVHFSHFLPAGSSTMASYSTLLTGVPYAGVNISRLAASGKPLLTATPEIFKRLGYRTRLYYGGFLSWQNIGALSRAQGIEESFAAPNIESEAPDGVWGVADEKLFDYVLKNTAPDLPTFNIILTTSYHPPYSVDVRSKGFELAEIPPDLADTFEGTITLNQLGHIWYSDHATGNFVAAVEARFPSSLFAITGDHYSRRFLNAKPSIYERSSVPLILYGPATGSAAPGPQPAPGSHLDAAPTLIDLIAPEGFRYYSFGRSLLETGREQFGIGHQTIITGNFIANLKIERQPYPLPDVPEPIDTAGFEVLTRRHDQLLGLGWWLIFRGPELAAGAGAR